MKEIILISIFSIASQHGTLQRGRIEEYRQHAIAADSFFAVPLYSKNFQLDTQRYSDETHLHFYLPAERSSGSCPVHIPNCKEVPFVFPNPQKSSES